MAGGPTGAGPNGTETEHAVDGMRVVLGASRQRHSEAFAGAAVSAEDFRALHAVMTLGDHATPARLAEVMIVTRAAMTSRLDRLAAGGLVTREPDAVDRRRVVVRLTDAGRDTWSRSVDAAMERDRLLLKALSAEELQQLNALLRKLVHSLET